MGFLSSILGKRLVGLDIGVSGIKAVELGGTRKAPRLMAYNRVPLPWNTISPDGDVKQRQVVINALQKLFESRVFTSKTVAVGAFGNSIMTKKISVPRMSATELGHQLYFEAEQYIPFNVADVNLDFAIIGNNNTPGNTGASMMDVLLVAAKKDYIQSLTSLVQEAGLSAEVVDSQTFALGNSFEFNYGHLIETGAGAVASVIIDFGAGSTKISVVEGDKTTFTRELRQCGIDCTLLLSERLGIPFDQAERVKIMESGAPEVKAVIEEFVHSLTEEITRTLDFFVSQSNERNIQGIYICGGASRTDGLGEALEAKLPAPVQSLNPIQNVAGSGAKMSAQAIRELSYLGAVAIGLALRTSGDSR